MPPTPPVVVVVDDEPDTLESLAAAIEHVLDVQVIQAGSAARAFVLMRNYPPDLVLSDYRMPEVNGIDLLQKVRQDFPRAGRVLVTAYPDVDTVIKAVNEAGIEHFITKPTSVEEVVQAVRETLERHYEEDPAAQEMVVLRMAMNVMQTNERIEQQLRGIPGTGL